MAKGEFRNVKDLFPTRTHASTSQVLHRWKNAGTLL